MNTTKTIQSRRDLDYAKYQLNTLIALFNYENAESMLNLNKTRAFFIVILPLYLELLVNAALLKSISISAVQPRLNDLEIRKGVF